MATQAENIADLVVSTITKYEKKGVVDLYQTLQSYKARSVIGKMKQEECPSHTYAWNVVVASNNAAEMVGLGATGNPTIANLQAQASVNFKRARTHWAYDDEEMSLNDGGETRIVNMIKVRQMDAMRDLADIMERQWWGRPSGTSDDLSMFGIKYWLVQNATSGFNGSVPGGGYTTVAGLNPTTYTTWRNYTGAFAAVDIANFVNLLDEASYKCDFEPPVEFANIGGAGELKHAYYTTFETQRAMTRLMETRQDNIGPESAPDLGRYFGKGVYRSVPVIAVPYLDNNTSNNPFYGISFDTWKYMYAPGWKQKTYRPEKDPNQPTMNVVWVYSQGNFVCINRRRNFVLYNSTSGSADT